MLMDLTCPAEFRSVEVLRDSGGRGQAYLTFTNLRDREIDELHAMVTLLDGDGVSLGIRPLRYRNLGAQGRAQFTLCLAMDDLPMFEDARVTIQRVHFADGGDWSWDEDALMDCTPKELVPGPERVALVAVAGSDAICWPEQRRDAWVCVCGRFNENLQYSCQRCGRNRERTFAQYQLQAVMDAYRAQQQRTQVQERRQREEATEQAKQKQTRRQKDYAQRVEQAKRRRRRTWVIVVAAVLVGFGVWNVLAAVLGTALTQRPSGADEALPTALPHAPAILAQPTAVPTTVPQVEQAQG